MFLERLLLLCAKNGTDISNVLRALGLSTSKGTAWRKGSIPNGEILLMLAEHFSTSTDYLLGNTDDPSPPGAEGKPTPVAESGLSEDQKFLIDTVIDMTSDEARRFRLIVEEVILRRGQ